jgi:hypothetical protein
MLGIKLGAFFGYKPYDTYFDLDRDIENDRSLKLLFVPRYILIAFVSAGLISFLIFDTKNRFLALPIIVALQHLLGSCIRNGTGFLLYRLHWQFPPMEYNFCLIN